MSLFFSWVHVFVCLVCLPCLNIWTDVSPCSLLLAVDEYRDRDAFVSPDQSPMYNFPSVYDHSHYLPKNQGNPTANVQSRNANNTSCGDVMLDDCNIPNRAPSGPGQMNSLSRNCGPNNTVRASNDCVTGTVVNGRLSRPVTDLSMYNVKPFASGTSGGLSNPLSTVRQGAMGNCDDLGCGPASGSFAASYGATSRNNVCGPNNSCSDPRDRRNLPEFTGACNYEAPRHNQYHIPGYAGFVEGARPLYGDTFGKLTRKVCKYSVCDELCSSFSFLCCLVTYHLSPGSLFSFFSCRLCLISSKIIAMSSNAPSLHLNIYFTHNYVPIFSCSALLTCVYFTFSLVTQLHTQHTFIIHTCYQEDIYAVDYMLKYDLNE